MSIETYTVEVNGIKWYWFSNGVVLNIVRPRFRYPIVIVDFLAWNGEPHPEQAFINDSYEIKSEDVVSYIAEFIDIRE